MTKKEMLENLKYVFLTNDVLSELISLSSSVMDKDQYFQAYFSTKIAAKLSEHLQYQGIILENLYAAIDNQFDADEDLAGVLNKEIEKLRSLHE